MGSSKQLAIAESNDGTKVWETSNLRATRISGEMIALDCQPLSIVDDEGFIRLLRH